MKYPETNPNYREDGHFSVSVMHEGRIIFYDSNYHFDFKDLNTIPLKFTKLPIIKISERGKTVLIGNTMDKEEEKREFLVDITKKNGPRFTLYNQKSTVSSKPEMAEHVLEALMDYYKTVFTNESDKLDIDAHRIRATNSILTSLEKIVE